MAGALGLAAAVHPRALDGLPGLAVPWRPRRYPARDEVVDYLTDYARRFHLPVGSAAAWPRFARDGDGYLVELDGGPRAPTRSSSRPGPFQVPAGAGNGGALDAQFRSCTARTTGARPTCPPDRVLVVGGGNTGFQIAEELAGAREVHLSIGSRQMPLPQRILGRDLFWYLTATGLMGEDRRARASAGGCATARR